jgi:hypothetical protein
MNISCSGLLTLVDFLQALADGFAIDKALASHAPPMTSIKDSAK